jgi:CRISPR-associated protein Cas1
MWLPGTRELYAPEVIDLPRVTDRVSFLYLDGFKVRQDETGVVARAGQETLRVPIASTLVLMLGPGTSVSTPAVLTLTRHGTTVQWCGSSGVGVSSTAMALTSSAPCARAQASAWADERSRLQVARSLYARRFGAAPPSDTTIEQLRSLEGRRVKAAYAELCHIHGLRGWRRRHRPDGQGGELDDVNVALNVANGVLYGIAASVVGALGLHPALGFVHIGNHRSFVLDLADVYKVTTSMVVAFACSGSKEPAQVARRAMRDYISRLRIHADMVRLVESLFATDDGLGENSLIADEGWDDTGGWNVGGA